MNGMKSIPKCASITKPFESSARNLVNLWAQLVVEELIRLGVKLVCIAPGSRCTPLVAACARRPELEKIVCQDERSAAFCALGFAKATRVPAVVISTSGSAVANLFPAVVEASNDHVPLLVLTADRPPELRAVGANQTIDQAKIFGGYVRSFVDMPVPDEKVSLRFVLSTIDEAFACSTSLNPGPVHLNFMFREPFDLDADEQWNRALLEPIANWASGCSPLGSRPHIDEVAQLLSYSESGVIVAGAIDDEEGEAAVLHLSEQIGWPLLPDVLSNLRFSDSTVVANFVDLALLDDRLSARPPDVVLQFGGRLVSKRLHHFLDKGKSRAHVIVETYAERLDPACVATHRLRGPIGNIAQSLSTLMPKRDCASSRWIESSKLVEASLLEQRVDDSLSEISVARSLVAAMSEAQFLFCASSMPIRDLNMFGARCQNPPRIYANRGASGIDGIISSACGVSKALKKRGVLLCGDLTFLYDTNGLSLLKSLETPLTIVVVNNQGGGIFTMLEVHKQKDIFTPYFDAEHQTDLSGLSSAYQIEFERVNELEHWHQVLAGLSSSTHHRVIEVVSDKWRNKELHDLVRESIRARFSD